MRGAWVGFSWGHTQAHFFRAVLESVAFEYAYYLEILRDQIPTLELLETRVVGGGARSRVWNQIKADVLGLPYQRLSRSEFGTWGSALIAGRSAGLFNDLALQAFESTQLNGKAVTPDRDNHERYIPLTKKYIELEKNLQHYFKE
jgi:xylulokinase